MIYKFKKKNNYFPINFCRLSLKKIPLRIRWNFSLNFGIWNLVVKWQVKDPSAPCCFFDSMEQMNN